MSGKNSQTARDSYTLIYGYGSAELPDDFEELDILNINTAEEMLRFNAAVDELESQHIYVNDDWAQYQNAQKNYMDTMGAAG